MKSHRMSFPVRTFLTLSLVGTFLAGSQQALAGFTETLPEGMFMLDISYNHSWLDKKYDNSGNGSPLIEKIERYEPGGGMQGILTPNADVQYQVLINQLQYGILDNLSVGIGIPVVLGTSITPKFSWKEGDYQPSLGRAYSASDFWEWAESMGQPKPGYWRGNEGVLSDIVLGARFRYTDYIDWCMSNGLHSRPHAFRCHSDGHTSRQRGDRLGGNHHVGSAQPRRTEYPSGRGQDLRRGTGRTFDPRFGFLLRSVFLNIPTTQPSGKVHPLLLNYEPYVGKTYKIDPGDFSGFSFQTDVIPYKGPVLETWITPKDEEARNKLPAIFAFNLRYTFTHLQQSQWTSQSDLWDYDREDDWRPGYKNLLTGTVLFSLVRVGAPLQLYASYRTLSLIPGKNTRSADVLAGGLRLLMKFW